MVIDIKNLTHPVANGTADGRPVDRQDSDGRPAPTATDGGTPPQNDRVELTEAVRRLAALESSIRDLPVVDSQRVEALRRAIERGEYAIDPAQLSDRLLDLDDKL